MANINESTRWLYSKLTGLGYNVGKDVDEFDNLMRTNGESRRWAYETASKNGLNVGKDITEFSSLVGGTAATPVKTEPAQTATSATRQTVSATVKPVMDNTSQKAAVQPTVSKSATPTTSSTPTTPAQPKWTPSEVDKLHFQQQMDMANARLRKQSEEALASVEGIKKGAKSGAFMGEREVNPATGETEKVYYTTRGERVATPMEQSKANTEHHQWWENNTEEGRRSKEMRLKREEDRRQEAFETQLSGLWQRHDTPDTANAAEQAWSAAEERQRKSMKRNADDVYRYSGDAMADAALMGGPQSHTMNASEMSNRNLAARYSNFDLDRLMADSWTNLGEDGQKAIIEDCYRMLRSRNPGVDELALYNEAKELAVKQSNLRVYDLAVKKNLPKGNLEYLMRKIGDMNMMGSLQKGMAVENPERTDPVRQVLIDPLKLF